MTTSGKMLEINNVRKAIAAEIYWQIQDEIDQKLIIDYIYNDGLIEDSKLSSEEGSQILKPPLLFRLRRSISSQSCDVLQRELIGGTLLQYRLNI